EEDKKEHKTIPEAERKKLLYTYNDTKVEFASEKTAHEVFEEQVERTPGNIAVEYENQTLTYSQLNQKANRLARELRHRGVNGDSVVGLMVERSMEMIVGMMAILKAGGAFLPIGFEYPPERVHYMLEDCDTTIVLTDSGEKKFSHPAALIDISDEKNYQEDASNLSPVSPPTNLAYVIYTSGTTGTPKGVMIEHRALLNFVKGMTDIIEYRDTDVILSLITLSFDIFILETIVPLTVGAQVVIGNREEQTSSMAAASLIENKNITIFQATPSMLQLFAAHKSAAESFKHLRYLLVGGEIFPEPLLEKLRAVTEAVIYNLYGPTETTVWSTVKDVTGDKALNIGKPIANTTVYILDQNDLLLPEGEIGELCIGGMGVARGYLGKDALTAEKFVIDP
ncbi:MAG: amino acid adenylation domain-containing protein, partial [bacterium]|nr:amino acid adenylation domain-containing protein [bacterium]